MKQYDVIIIGAGPAGIFTGLELADKGLQVLILEKGRDITARSCPKETHNTPCVNCKPCDIVCGWGGAGAFSDGKLTLTTDYGGILDEYMDKAELMQMIEYVDSIYGKFGGSERKVYGDEKSFEVRHLQRMAAAADLHLIPARIRHLGTDVNLQILTRMREHLHDRIEIRSNTTVEKIVVVNGRYAGVEVKGEIITSKYLVAAPGREGSEWFVSQAAKLGLEMMTNPVDIGVRVEMPAAVFEHITDVVYESKLVYYSKSFDDRVRTFCMNPYGYVVAENNDGLMTVNGHSYADKKSNNTNFALLVSKSFTEPFKEPIAYGKYIARLANLLGGGVIVQRLGDLLDGRRSTPDRIRRGMVEPTMKDATPGDLSLVLPYRHLVDIREMFEALDKIAPGANSRHTLLYGVEVKFYSSRLTLTNKLESQIPNFFAIGDGAGVTRGLAQASVAGVVVAREILNREGGK